HDMIVTDNAENGRNIKLETMGAQIESCLKEGKPMIETMQELKIRPQLAWAVYLHGRENLGVYSYFSNLK
ncbi:MAG: hypothetical protein NTY22_07720, partial [Proteobacteria bacterium]|nr:hypothetical protein [Pseudomonadota bacterium]